MMHFIENLANFSYCINTAFCRRKMPVIFLSGEEEWKNVIDRREK